MRLAALALFAMLIGPWLAAGQTPTAGGDVEATMSLAKRHYRTGNFRAALQELDKVLELEPARADALYLVGYSHLMLREYPESVEAFGRAFEADPSFDPRTIYQARMEEPTG